MWMREAKHIGIKDRFSAKTSAEDVAIDTEDASQGTAIRLKSRGTIVCLYLKANSIVIIKGHHTGIVFKDREQVRSCLFELADSGLDAVKKHTKNGDHIVMAGGLVGRDGVHGATLSSLALDDSVGSDVEQIGDLVG